MKLLALLTIVSVTVFLFGCKKDEPDPNVKTFEQIGGIYDHEYTINFTKTAADSCKLKISADGTITEYRTTSNNKWIGHLNYLPPPDSLPFSDYSFFDLSNVQSNTDLGGSRAVRDTNDGCFNAVKQNTGLIDIGWSKPYRGPTGASTTAFVHLHQ